MAVRVLIVLAALAVLYGCRQASSPAEKQGTEGQNGKIAFVKNHPVDIHKHHRDYQIMDRDIYVMNPDGTGVRNLTNTSTVSEDVPAWSPDGEKIAFTIGSTYDLYVMNADGSDRTKLTDSSVSEASLAWSPDGEKIAFQGQTEGNPEDIYVMNADGTGRMRLSDTATAGETSPTWSPDGEKIAFWSTVGVDNAICVINADGTGRRCVADDAADDELPNGPGLAWGRG